MNKILLFLLFPIVCIGQATMKFTTSEVAVNPLLNGTLYTPEGAKKVALVILIAGSGPTDRNGNQTSSVNNSLKFLAESIAASGAAVYSYDKRIIAQVKAGTVDEKSLRFEDFINDAKEVITYFKAKKIYSKIIVAGHSEGSLIGMVAANGNADGYISLAGAGRTIDNVIIDQVEKQAPYLKPDLVKDFEILKKGETFTLDNQVLSFLFRDNLQQYMISWLKYDPTVEIKKLNIPVLLVNGDKDLQVKVSEAELLKQAKPDAKLVVIRNMNHIFKEIKGNDTENIASYTNPALPISVELSTAVNQFIKTF